MSAELFMLVWLFGGMLIVIAVAVALLAVRENLLPRRGTGFTWGSLVLYGIVSTVVGVVDLNGQTGVSAHTAVKTAALLNLESQVEYPLSLDQAPTAQFRWAGQDASGVKLAALQAGGAAAIVTVPYQNLTIVEATTPSVSFAFSHTQAGLRRDQIESTVTGCTFVFKWGFPTCDFDVNHRILAPYGEALQGAINVSHVTVALPRNLYNEVLKGGPHP